MKPNHALALARSKLKDDFTTVGVQFGAVGSCYTYMVLRKLRVKVGDMVVVPSSMGFRVVKVVRVDELPAIKGDEPYDFRWVVQRLDLQPYLKLVDLDRAFEAAVVSEGVLMREARRFLRSAV